MSRIGTCPNVQLDGLVELRGRGLFYERNCFTGLVKSVCLHKFFCRLISLRGCCHVSSFDCLLGRSLILALYLNAHAPGSAFNDLHCSRNIGGVQVHHLCRRDLLNLSRRNRSDLLGQRIAAALLDLGSLSE